MANSITQSPIIVDSAGSSILISQTLNVLKVVWNSGASGVAGDQVLLKDKNGIVKLDIALSAAKGKEEVSFPVEYPLQMHGLIAATISHGTIYIYTKERAPFSA